MFNGNKTRSKFSQIYILSKQFNDKFNKLHTKSMNCGDALLSVYLFSLK